MKICFRFVVESNRKYREFFAREFVLSGSTRSIVSIERFASVTATFISAKSLKSASMFALRSVYNYNLE